MAADAAARRVALVVGVGAYTRKLQLQAPAADALCVAKQLQEWHWETILCVDPTGTELHAQAKAFIELTATAECSLVYFSGHGQHSFNKQYLLAADFEDGTGRYQLGSNAIAVEDIWDDIKSGCSKNVFILDCCRECKGGAAVPSFEHLRAKLKASCILYAVPLDRTADGAPGVDGLSPFTACFKQEVFGHPDWPVIKAFGQVQKYTLQQYGPNGQAVSTCSHFPSFLDFCLAPQVRCERCVALVVGVANYAKLPVVNSCTEDAAVVSRQLQDLGWHAIPCPADANGEQLWEAVEQFVELAKDAEASFLYFSGKGVQFGNQQYLLASDFEGDAAGSKQPTKREWQAELLHKAYSVQDVLEELSSGKCPRNILVLDCCRRVVGNSAGTNSPHGSLRVDFLICYAVPSGQTSVGGVGGQLSPFTRHIVKALFEAPLGRSVFDALTEAQKLAGEALGGSLRPMLELTSAEPFQSFCMDRSCNRTSKHNTGGAGHLIY